MRLCCCRLMIFSAQKTPAVLAPDPVENREVRERVVIRHFKPYSSGGERASRHTRAGGVAGRVEGVVPPRAEPHKLTFRHWPPVESPYIGTRPVGFDPRCIERGSRAT